MKFKGKLIGAILGYLFGGYIGMAFGFIAGHLLDLGYFKAFIDVTQSNIHTHAQQLFFNNTFKIMGYVAKSDGHVSEKEIHTAQVIMSKMGLNDAQKQHAIQLFTMGKSVQFSIDASLFELRQIVRMQPALLQIFLDIQLQMASADGHLSPHKNAVLQRICAQLGVAPFQFHQHGQQNHYQYQTNTRSRASILSEAYQTLSVAQDATPEEIKKAYRRLMSQNHPDKLIAKGLPPEMIKVATQKTQRIKDAYEKIKEAKGM